MISNSINYFSELEIEDIKLAIQNVELDTSCEIRVHIDETCEGDCIDRAREVFEELRIFETRNRNGILFYLAIKNRKFALLPDIGIVSKVPPEIIGNLKMNLLRYFRQGEFVDGLVDTIEKFGSQIKEYFPMDVESLNELPDEVTFSNTRA